MDKSNAEADGGMEVQLAALYEDREYLERELGISDPQDIVAMVRSLEEQLNDFYAQKEQEAQ